MNVTMWAYVDTTPPQPGRRRRRVATAIAAAIAAAGAAATSEMHVTWSVSYTHLTLPTILRV